MLAVVSLDSCCFQLSSQYRYRTTARSAVNHLSISQFYFSLKHTPWLTSIPSYIPSIKHSLVPTVGSIISSLVTGMRQEGRCTLRYFSLNPWIRSTRVVKVGGIFVLWGLKGFLSGQSITFSCKMWETVSINTHGKIDGTQTDFLFFSFYCLKILCFKQASCSLCVSV